MNAQTPSYGPRLGLFGHDGHGTSTLARAAASVQRHGDPSRPGAILLDLPDDAGRDAWLRAHGAGLDGAILVVSAVDGPREDTLAHATWARRVGIPLVIVLNKVDLVDDDEILELVEMEIRDIASRAGFDGGNVPTARLSALRAADGDERWTARLRELLDFVGTTIPASGRGEGAPAAVEDAPVRPDEEVPWGTPGVEDAPMSADAIEDRVIREF